MRAKVGILLATAIALMAVLPGAALAGPREGGFCQVGDPSAGFPDRGPTYVLQRQVVETRDAYILTCKGPLVHFVGSDPVEIGNPSGTAATYTGFECRLGVGWLQQGHPPEGDLITFDSRQVTSASGQTTLRCVFPKT